MCEERGNEMFKNNVPIDPERVVTFMGIGVLWVVACVFYGMWEVGHYLYDMSSEVIPGKK